MDRNVTLDESLLPPGHVYRMVVSFTGALLGDELGIFTKF